MKNIIFIVREKETADFLSDTFNVKAVRLPNNIKSLTDVCKVETIIYSPESPFFISIKNFNREMFSDGLFNLGLDASNIGCNAIRNLKVRDLGDCYFQITGTACIAH